MFDAVIRCDVHMKFVDCILRAELWSSFFFFILLLHGSPLGVKGREHSPMEYNKIRKKIYDFVQASTMETDECLFYYLYKTGITIA